MTAPLWTVLALRDDYTAAGCWAWIESAERVCRKPEGDEPHLCNRHAAVARRKLALDADREQRRLEQAVADSLATRARRLARLAAVDAEIARLDPPPPTDDPAAYGGVGSTAARRYQARYTDERIARLAALHREREQLVRYLGGVA